MKGVDVVLLSSGRLLQELSPRVNVALLSLTILTSADVLLRVFQAWSPTQFYLFVFSQSWIVCKKCGFRKSTIKVCVSCLWWCPRNSMPSPTRHTLNVRLVPLNSGSNTQGKVECPCRGATCQLKKPYKVQRRVVAGRNGSEKCSQMRGHWFFNKRQTEKNELAATPGVFWRLNVWTVPRGNHCCWHLRRSGGGSIWTGNLRRVKLIFGSGQLVEHHRWIKSWKREK